MKKSREITGSWLGILNKAGQSRNIHQIRWRCCRLQPHCLCCWCSTASVACISPCYPSGGASWQCAAASTDWNHTFYFNPIDFKLKFYYRKLYKPCKFRVIVLHSACHGSGSFFNIVYATVILKDTIGYGLKIKLGIVQWTQAAIAKSRLAKTLTFAIESVLMGKHLDEVQ